MIKLPAVIEVPLREDQEGVIRIGNTRISLQTIIDAYKRGNSVEEIVEAFPNLRLADVHALISFYLNHRAKVDEYVRQQKEEAEKIWREIETNHPEMLHAQAKFQALQSALNGSR
jgi:uncharacterized protein (DUF433 family)